MSFNAGQDLYGTQYSVPQEGNFGMGPQPQQNQPSERSHTLPGATDPRFAPAYTGNIPYGANFSTYPHPNFPIGTPLQNSTSLDPHYPFGNSPTGATFGTPIESPNVQTRFQSPHQWIAPHSVNPGPFSTVAQWGSSAGYSQHPFGLYNQNIYQPPLGADVQPPQPPSRGRQSVASSEGSVQHQATPRRRRRSHTSRTSTLQARRPSAEAQKLYQCDLCPRQFSRKADLQLHRDRHDPKYARRYTCKTPGCDFGTSTIRAFRSHLKKERHHGGDED